jgi:hypothetical protein
MGPIQKLELQLDDLLRKKAPFQLPENARKSIAAAMWWIALILGILQLWAAWALWRAADRVDELVDFANSINIYGAAEPVSHLGFFFYFSLALLALDGIILIAAYRGLQKLKKQGWNLLFYSVLLNLAAGLVMIFSEYGGGVGDFIRSLLFSTVGAYFLFQIREYFTGAKSISAAAEAPKAPKAEKPTEEKTAK